MKKEKDYLSKNNYKSISANDFLSEIAKQQSDSTRSLVNRSLDTKERQIIDLESKKRLKIINCTFSLCDFMNITLDDNEDRDQRICEGTVFRNCSFVNLSGIYSMNECSFIDCTFAQSNMHSTLFIDCFFKNSSASDCDFTMANFSLSNYKDFYVDETCKKKRSLLDENDSDVRNIQTVDNTQRIEIALHLMSTSLKLLYDSMRYIDDDHMQLDPIASNLSLFIQEKEKLLEFDDLVEKEENALLRDLGLHEDWANMIVKNQYMKPELDWRRGNYRGFDFSDRNLSHIDFEGSSLKGCDFTGCNLTNVNFTKCNLTGAVFTRAIFSDNCFDDAKLENITIDKRNLEAFRKAGIAINTNETGLQERTVKRIKVKI